MRGTGGNRFIEGDADLTVLLHAIHDGLHELHDWANDVGRGFDAGAITIDTKRIPNGRISVSVTGDLLTTWKPNDWADHDAGHPSGHDCDGCAITGSERCARVPKDRA